MAQIISAFVAIACATAVLFIVASILDRMHYVKCTNQLIAAGVLSPDFWEKKRRGEFDKPQDANDTCRLKREAKERGEHIVP